MGFTVTKGLASAAIVGLFLQGCAEPPKPASTTRLYASDFAGGAKLCTVPKVAPPAPGKEVTTTMTVGNDGGWCGITVDNNGHPFDAGLLVARPAHGRVLVHSVGDATRIDYTPNPGYAGPDNFSVRLLPTEGMLHTTVTASK